MKKLLISLLFIPSLVFSQGLIVGQDVQNTSANPLGVEIWSATNFTSAQTTAHIGLQRKQYRTFSAGTGNDRDDKVGIWIKGYYQNVGESVPIYLGGNGYASEDFKMLIENNGNVGIGVSTSDSRLQVKGAGSTSSTASFHAVNNVGTSLMYVRDDGNVGIGTTTPQAKLSVNGDIFSKKVKVSQTGWPDYVFNHNYELLPLSSLERFIRTNKHLPEIPSAAQIEKEGLDVGENQAALLKKIEELTLYIIDLNKRLEKFEKQAK